MDVKLPSLAGHSHESKDHKHGHTDPGQPNSKMRQMMRVTKGARMCAQFKRSDYESDQRRSSHARSTDSEHHSRGQEVKSEARQSIGLLDEERLSSRPVAVRSMYSKARTKLKKYSGKDDAVGKVTLKQAENSIRLAAHDTVRERNLVTVFMGITKEAIQRRAVGEEKYAIIVEETASAEVFVKAKAVWLTSLLEELGQIPKAEVTSPQQEVEVQQLKTDLSDLQAKLQSLSLLYAKNEEDTIALQAQMDALTKNLASILGRVGTINPELNNLVSPQLASLQETAVEEGPEQPATPSPQPQEPAAPSPKARRPSLMRNNAFGPGGSTNTLEDAMGSDPSTPKIFRRRSFHATPPMLRKLSRAFSGLGLLDSLMPPAVPSPELAELQHEAPSRQVSPQSPPVLLPPTPEPVRQVSPPAPEWDLSVYEHLEPIDAGLQPFIALPLHPHVYHCMGTRKVTLPPLLQELLNASQLPELDRRLRCPFVLVPREDGRYKKLPAMKQCLHRRKQDPSRFTVEAVLAEREHRGARPQEDEQD